MMLSNLRAARNFNQNRSMSKTSQKRETLQWLLVNVSLIIGVFAYAFIGAAVFVAIEGPNEAMETQRFESAREILLEHIHDMIDLAVNDNTNGTMVNISASIRVALDIFEENMTHAVCTHHIDRKGEVQWNFYTALFFSATTISMIGKFDFK